MVAAGTAVLEQVVQVFLQFELLFVPEYYTQGFVAV